MIFYSHADEGGNPQKELKEHLKGVAEDARSSVTQTPVEDRHYLAEIAYLIGISHDFGKYTSFFQEHLLKKKDWGRKSRHSFLSALFAAWQVQKYLKENNPRKEIFSYLPLVAYFVVLHHHGDLGSLEVDVPSIKYLKDSPKFPYAESNFRERLKITYEQVDDLKHQERLDFIEESYRRIGVMANVKIFLDLWLEFLITLSRLSWNFKYKTTDDKKIMLSLITSLLYSALIDADKRDAGEVPKISRKKLPEDLVDKYREAHFDLQSLKPINLIRNEIYGRVTHKIKEVSLQKHLFTLTAPTGSGKTLTAFSTALKLQARIEKEKGYTPRIIYSLPFITIIEQNYEVIRNVLSSEIKDFEENETSYLLKHHHLTDLKYKEGKEDRPLDEALLLIESWQSEIIVTTFVQFLHTVIGFKNKFLKKYHNIAGSVILLDEVQNIPIEYWDIVEKIIKLLATHFGCYFILLTATKPLILKEKDAVELVEDSQNYFKKLNRVVIKSDINNRRSIDEFVEWLKDNYNSKKSYLIVANTIRSSKEIYEKIKSYNLNNCLFYLSTSIVPKQRAARIKAVKNLLNSGNKPILVSTQVVEAGVDLDFDTVIRDVGPVDSIIQIAGRCNREYNKTQREAYIFSLDHFANYVYGKIHPDVSKKLLRDQEIQESDFHELTNRYFEEVRCKINDDVSKYVWEAMLELRFYQKNPPQRGGHNIQVSEFQLIDEKGEYANIFVEIDEEAQAIWKEYCEKVYGERNFLKRRRAYLSIRKKFRSYIISVRIDKKIALPTQVCGLRYIPQGQLEDFYSIETGFGADVTGTFVW